MDKIYQRKQKITNNVRSETKPYKLHNMTQHLSCSMQCISLEISPQRMQNLLLKKSKILNFNKFIVQQIFLTLHNII